MSDIAGAPLIQPVIWDSLEMVEGERRGTFLVVVVLCDGMWSGDICDGERVSVVTMSEGVRGGVSVKCEYVVEDYGSSGVE